jgi:HAD superfamily hydrolase (TIGR01509 family)
MVNAAIFDMDGVLVDSEQYWQRRLEETLLPSLTEAQIDTTEVKGKNMHDIYAHVAEISSPKISEPEFVNRYCEHAEDIYRNEVQLLPRCHELFDELRDNGVAVAIASSSPQNWIEIVLQRFDLSDLIDEVVSANRIDIEGKPSPDIYRYAADSLGVVPQECVAIEDSKSGIQAAQEANIYCIGFSITDPETPDLKRADDIARTREQLEQKLLTLV